MVADQPAARARLRAAIARLDHLLVAGECARADMVHRCRDCAADLVLIEIATIRPDDAALARDLAAVGAKVIVSAPRASARQVEQLINVGVDGFVPRTAGAQPLAQAMTAALRGDTFFGDSGPVASQPQTLGGDARAESPETGPASGGGGGGSASASGARSSSIGSGDSDTRGDDSASREPARAQPLAAKPNLTPREAQVLKLLTDGMLNKQIAQHLDVSVRTVERYRGQIMAKLGVQSMAALVKVALRMGMTTL